MKKLLVAACLFVAPAVAMAEDNSPPSSTAIKDARLVPAMKDGALVGLKIYAIRPGGRFDQPQAPFLNGDTIQSVDGVFVMLEAGAKALHDNVIEGKADAEVVVLRKGATVTLASKRK
jgi:hypothetical protein